MRPNASISNRKRTLVLASTSPYRVRLMHQLGLDFVQCRCAVDESPLAGEQPRVLVQRLAAEKAKAAAISHPDALIIGADQVGVLDGRLLTKPGTLEVACRQLSQSSGRVVNFHTGVCLLDAAIASVQVDSVPFEVRFRQLSNETIRCYVELEQPLDCAGSFRVEGLGISLFSALRGEDPSALQGLPLIRLCSMLEKAGKPVIDTAAHNQLAR